MPEDSLIVITSAIKTAFIDHPSSGHGTTWDQVAKSDEESIHLPKLCWLPFAKPDIPSQRSTTKMPRGSAPPTRSEPRPWRRWRCSFLTKFFVFPLSIERDRFKLGSNVANLAPPRTPLRTGFPLSPRDAPRNSGSRPVHNAQRLYPRLRCKLHRPRPAVGLAAGLIRSGWEERA